MSQGIYLDLDYYHRSLILLFFDESGMALYPGFIIWNRSRIAERVISTLYVQGIFERYCWGVMVLSICGGEYPTMWVRHCKNNLNILDLYLWPPGHLTVCDHTFNFQRSGRTKNMAYSFPISYLAWAPIFKTSSRSVLYSFGIPQKIKLPMGKSKQ